MQLVDPAIPRKKRGSTHLHRGLGKSAVTNAGERAHDDKSKVRFLGAFHLLDGVSLDDVADLVAERSGELVEAVCTFDKTAVHINESAWQRECVDLLRVDHVKVPVQVRPAGLFGD